jgi:hypothetical protein
MRILAPAVLAALLILSGFDTAAAQSGRAKVAAPGSLEATRVSAFVESRYQPKEVQHSFHTVNGETIDCIDFFAQPGVKALAARGVSVPLPPAADTSAITGPLAELAFLGQPDDEGKPRICKSPTVPMLRVTPEMIAAAGGIDAYQTAFTRKGRPPTNSAVGGSPQPPAGPAFANYAHVTSTSSITSGITLGRATFNTYYAFGMPATGEHSITQLWISDNGTFTPDGVTPGTKQTIEAGIVIDAAQYPSETNLPHFFIFTTNNGYLTNCWNGSTATGCPVWVTAPGAPLTPGTGLLSGHIDHPQIELTLSIQENPGASGGWSVAVSSNGGQGSTVGHYKNAAYTAAFQAGATSFQVGAEIYDGTKAWVIPMGWGGNATAGATGTAYIRNYSAIGTGACSGKTTAACWSAPVDERTSGYDFSNTATPGTGWTNYFYVGNHSHVFWGQNYGFEWTPVGDWSPGSYKGECPQNYPVVGLSKYTTPPHSHAVRCATQPVAASSGCYIRTMYASENRGFSGSGDWDPGYYKTECGWNEYVAGVSQSTSGVPTGILCCASASVAHNNCTTEVLGNAFSAGSPFYFDWDVGFYKARCSDATASPASKIVGVSSTTASPRTPHSILCCQ